MNEPWLSRFRLAALVGSFQQAQVETALGASDKSLAAIRRFAPNLGSERSIGFMVDVANQFGDAGAEGLYVACHCDGMSEMDLLEAIADETVARVDDSFKAGVRSRRDRFLNTPFLTDEPFAAVGDVHGAVV